MRINCVFFSDNISLNRYEEEHLSSIILPDKIGAKHSYSTIHFVADLYGIHFGGDFGRHNYNKCSTYFKLKMNRSMFPMFLKWVNFHTQAVIMDHIEITNWCTIIQYPKVAESNEKALFQKHCISGKRVNKKLKYQSWKGKSRGIFLRKNLYYHTL